MNQGISGSLQYHHAIRPAFIFRSMQSPWEMRVGHWKKEVIRPGPQCLWFPSGADFKRRIRLIEICISGLAFLSLHPRMSTKLKIAWPRLKYFTAIKVRQVYQNRSGSLSMFVKEAFSYLILLFYHDHVQSAHLTPSMLRTALFKLCFSSVLQQS